MTRIEEKLYLQSVFDAIDEVYKLKSEKNSLTYEERLRASFNKLIVPDWFNHDYTTINGLRKTKSHGQVPRIKRYDNNNNHYFDDVSNGSISSSSTNSSHLSNGGGTHRHRSPSRSWSERAPPLRRNSTTSSYDTNGSRYLTNPNGTTSTYAPGMQRVTQSSTWYKPKVFTMNRNTNGHSTQPPKPLPRYLKIDQDRIDTKISLSTLSNGTIRHPIKPRIMAQIPIPIDQQLISDDDSQILSSSRPVETITHISPTRSITNTNQTTISNFTTNMISDNELYDSAKNPPQDQNLLMTDSSSYNSVNDQCMSTSISSYHTAVAGDTSSSSSINGYETPTPQFDDETLSSHSSISDLSHADTLEPNNEDLDIVAVSREEQKSAIISSVDVGMENFPLPTFSSSLIVNENSPSVESRPIENTNWYDDGSIATCIDQTSPKVPSKDLREISNEHTLHEVDLNGISDEFYLVSPRNIIDDDDEHTNSINDDKTSKQLYTIENKNLNLDDDIILTDDFHYSSTQDPFGYNNNNPAATTPTTTSIMITNLDDILIDDDDDDDDDMDQDKNSSSYLLNINQRRPIQEDILYEVEHENSYSDHSQNTSSIILAEDTTSNNRIDQNLDYLTSTEQPMNTQTSSQDDNTQLKETTTLPIYIPSSPSPSSFYTTNEKSSTTLRVDTTSYPSNLFQYSNSSTLLSPSFYTSKIRQRHYSVGSYYDNKTTTVAIHPNHTLYIIGSAPVSPISRTSTTSSESHYHIHHHSPASYANGTINALRRVNPFLETNTFLTNYEYPRISSISAEDSYQTRPTKVENIPSKPFSFSSPSPPPLIAQDSPPLVRPKTSRGRARSSPPLPPHQTTVETDETQNIYQEIEDNQSATPNADLQFIRGTIERVFDFHGESTTSESSTYYEKVSEDNQNNNESSSLSTTTSKTETKKSNQYPAVEAVQRFYDTKSPSNSEKNISKPLPPLPPPQTTNLDDVSTTSTSSHKLHARSHPTNIKRPNLSKSSEDGQVSSEDDEEEEVDDTLNDIEDDESQDDKLKRQATNHSSHTSHENSPIHLSDRQTHHKKTSSQQTQTFQQQKPIILTRQSPSAGSQSTIQSFETAHSTIPPLDIVTQMVIERTDGLDDGRITEISGDMIIYYDDIEIVEHSSNMSSTESETTSSSISKSIRNSRPIQTVIELPPPPPIPARTLKPRYLLDNQQQQQQQQQSPSKPIDQAISKINRTYELEKSTIRKRIDVNTVNDMINRNDYNMGPTPSHRHPSARHFVGKLNSDDTISSRHSTITTPQQTMVKSQTLPLPLQTIPTTNTTTTTNGHSKNSTSSYSTLPTRSDNSRTTVPNTNALIKQIQNSLSRNSLLDTQFQSPLSISTKDLRTFVSATYSPSDENLIDDDGIIHSRQEYDEQAFKRQARLSKSFHNVSEYNTIDQYPKKQTNLISKPLPSKSVENNLNRVSQNPSRHSHIPINFPPIIASTSFSGLPHSDDNARLLSMKWYTGQVSENSEICYNTPHNDNDDLLYGYISTHSNRDIQSLFSRLQASNDVRIHAALDDIRLRVAQFDASKTPGDLPVFMRYLESRLRDIYNKNTPSSTTTTSTNTNGQRRISNDGKTNGYHHNQQQQQADSISIKSRTSSVVTGASKDTPPPSRQLGRHHLRSSGNLTGISGGGTNGHQPLPPPRRASQSSVNQENPAVFDDMLNTVLGLPKKGASTLPPAYPSSSTQGREKPTPLTQTQMSTNTTIVDKNGREIGKRLFESGTYKDPRLIYDGPKKNEKEEQPLETSV